MKQLVLISYVLTFLLVFGVIGFAVWWPLAVYVWHYWFGMPACR